MLTLGYSTTGSNILRVLHYLSSFRNKNITFLIVCQMYDTPKPSVESLKSEVDQQVALLKGKLNIEVQFFDEKGLSKSRNRVIEYCKTQYLWFLDDDVELELDEVEKLTCELASTQANATLVRIGSLEKREEFYKDYSSFKLGEVINPLLLLRASSIEMVVDVNFLKLNSIRFNESLGLGTSYPCCEENLLLLEMKGKGALIVTSELKPVYHTTMIEHRVSIGEGHFLARGYVAAQYPFYLRFPLIFRWATRSHHSFHLFERLRLLIAGANINV